MMSMLASQCAVHGSRDSLCLGACYKGSLQSHFRPMSRVTVCVLIRFLDAFCVPVHVGWSVLSVAASSFRKSFEGITESPILQMDRYTGALHIENIC